MLDSGTCSLHPVPTAFRKGVSELTYDIDGFLEDLYFFFKYSSARRKDFLAIQDLTNVTAQFLKQPAETRWIAIKYVAIRVLDQYPNIKEYFLKFLPKEKNFRSTVEKTDRYKRICKYLNDSLVEAALSFCGYIANDFEEFLKPFQSNEPKIHLMYPAMCQLVANIMHKFVSRKVLSGDAAKNIAIDVEKAENLKPVKLIDVGTKGKQLLSDPTFSKADQTKFRNGCMNFYKKSTKYLVDHLPLNRPILQYAQYLHPEKRNAHGATNAISNLAFKLASVMKGRHSSVFDLPASTTVDEVCYKVRDQWLRYQYEEVKDDWYKRDTNDVPTTSKVSQASYWQDAMERCGLVEGGNENFESCYKRIDHYWRKIGELVDEDGGKKYTELANLALTVCSLSHGNAAPERGFSVNKALLESHGYTIQEDTIVSLRIVKDWINVFGGTLKFPIENELWERVKGARAKCMTYLEEKKILEEQERRKREEEADNAQHQAEKQSQVDKLNDDIERCEIGLKTAEEIIDQGNAKLQDALSSKVLNKNDLVSAQAKISIGLDRKRQCDKELAALKLKKAKLIK